MRFTPSCELKSYHFCLDWLRLFHWHSHCWEVGGGIVRRWYFLHPWRYLLLSHSHSLSLPPKTQFFKFKRAWIGRHLRPDVPTDDLRLFCEVNNSKNCMHLLCNYQSKCAALWTILWMTEEERSHKESSMWYGLGQYLTQRHRHRAQKCQLPTKIKHDKYPEC